ncbi:MAG: hypothetical protein A2Z21_09675 [Candidatus Fraserbacteria bacterium RBG_16_55_9]|uniref:Uncharacterized protein n=1 Tax=Fraserbacteria sp. (strain RBG_16_55_9) TaxID=1817864 RepID=A0A1F5UPX4_FRAXR|nr:MAG: hypothetical protein A2Z21_09675 [Candidatus Fraserbacteria bacterium RBG_16_55_9]
MPFLTGELELALATPGCSICRIVRQHEERWIFHTLWEYTGDPGVRAKFDASYGLCHPHAYLMFQVVEGHQLGGSGVARMYETVVPKYREKLAELLRPKNMLKRWLRAKPQALTELKVKGCMLCRVRRDTARGAVFFLLQALQEDPETWHELVRKSDGFCNPHLLLILKDEQACGNPAFWQFLVDDHLQRLEELERQLYGFQRKQSYDVDEEISAEEARSWQEAIWRFTGMDFNCDHPVFANGLSQRSPRFRPSTWGRSGSPWHAGTPRRMPWSYRSRQRSSAPARLSTAA